MSGVVSGVIWCQRLLWEKPGCALHWPHWAHAKQRIVSLLAPISCFSLTVWFENKWSETKKKIPWICPYSSFICSLFPENLNTEKKGRPTTASSKIKVRISTETMNSNLEVLRSVYHSFFLSLNAGNNKYRVVTMHWSFPGVPDRDKLTIWWTHWWNALHTISAVSNLMRPKDQKTGRRAG